MSLTSGNAGQEVTETVRKLRTGVPVPESTLEALADFLECYRNVTIGPSPSEDREWPKGWSAADHAQAEFARAFNAATGG